MIFSVCRIVDSHIPTKTLWILSILLSLNYQYFQHHSYCNNNEYYQYYYHYTIIINTEQRVAECATDSSQLSDWTRHKPPLLSRQNLNQPFIEERVKSGPKINNVQNTRVSTAQQHISYIPSQNNHTNYESFVSELLSNVKLINNMNIKIFYCMILTKFSLVIRTKFILHSLTCFNSCTNMFFNFYWYTHTYERHCLQSIPVESTNRQHYDLQCRS